MQIVLTGLIFFGMSAIASAEELPRYDPEAHCKEIAAFGGSYSATLNESCLQMEQGSYDRLKASWVNLDENMQAHCDEIARFGGKGSYQLLDSCISMEKSAASKKTKFKF